MTVLRLFHVLRFNSFLSIQKRGSLYCYRNSFLNYFSTKSASEERDDIENASYFHEIKENFKAKIIYHSFYKYESFTLGKRKEFVKNTIKQKRIHKISVLPVSLKYILDGENKSSVFEDNNEKNDDQEEEKVVLPYEVTKLNLPLSDQEQVDETPENLEGYVEDPAETCSVDELIVDQNFQYRTSGKWMRDYDCYEEVEEEEESDIIVGGGGQQKKYGTPNPSIPMSNVPCGGCGALLHCQDPGIPGYLPSEIFALCNVQELRSITCQRCHFMKNYNTALSVSVDPSSYPKLLSKIKNEKALVILLVDITDFPCSIWPGILDIIGPRRPLFVIGNKIDLIVGDRKGWMRRVRESLKEALPKNANIIYSSVISAKTGFGVEELINKLHNLWQYKGDVYLVGCTNVGKSTLFNALLASDYCKVQASDLLQRATTAPWPGTTMNLLKFPILRPSGVRLFLRTQRLQEDRKRRVAEKELLKIQMYQTEVNDQIQLVDHIGRTFRNVSEYNEPPDPFRASRRVRSNQLPESGLDPKDSTYKNSKWLYDTPGVVHSDQIIDLLTTEELMTTLPKTPITHRVFIFKKNWTLFIAGLGRLDLVELSECKDNLIKIVVFRPQTLPVTICQTEIADSLYNEFLGTPMFVVPSGGPERLKVWPSLKSTDDIVLQGKSFNESCGDIVLSNAGWISVTAGEGVICKFRCWTPDARGIHVRQVPLMRYAVTVHGSRVSKTPAYSSRSLKEAMFDRSLN